MFIAYHTTTTRYAPTGKQSYETERAAKAALTRMMKADPTLNREDYAIADSAAFYNTIELQVERVNAMTGKKYMESVNTPNSCSPASETYWSM